MCHNVSVPCRMTGEHGDLGMGAISRMQVVVRCERVSHLDLRTLERQSLCESHRQRRWLTCWSHREGHEARGVGEETMPLDQDIEGGHGERQARLKIGPAPMHHLLQMANEC